MIQYITLHFESIASNGACGFLSVKSRSKVLPLGSKAYKAKNQFALHPPGIKADSLREIPLARDII